ncbi:MAG: hypothetical protein Q9214_006903 [Letrouitia sp. 1 TL-2023]
MSAASPDELQVRSACPSVPMSAASPEELQAWSTCPCTAIKSPTPEGPERYVSTGSSSNPPKKLWKEEVWPVADERGLIRPSTSKGDVGLATGICIGRYARYVGQDSPSLDLSQDIADTQDFRIKDAVVERVELGRPGLT